MEFLKNPPVIFLKNLITWLWLYTLAPNFFQGFLETEPVSALSKKDLLSGESKNQLELLLVDSECNQQALG